MEYDKEVNAEATVEVHAEVDARGLRCPLPILKAKKALSGMLSGQILRIVATDPGSARDFEAFSRQTGNALVSSTRHDEDFVFLMRRK